MTIKTISTYVAGGYTLNMAKYSGLVITSTGGVGGTGVIATFNTTIQNSGLIKGAGRSTGVLLTNGGTVTNEIGGSISGYDGVYIGHAAGTVENYGSIAGNSNFFGVELLNGGTVVNGSATDTGASITGVGGGIYSGALGGVANFGTIVGAADNGVHLLAGGNVTNGSAADAAALIEGYSGVFSSAFGSVANYGMIESTGGFGDGVFLNSGGTVANLGTLRSTHYDGVLLQSGGSVINGAATHTTALISGASDGIEVQTGIASIANFGTITQTNAAGDGVYVKPAGCTVTNGTTASTSALISGQIGIHLFLAGSVANYATIQSVANVAVDLSHGGSVTNGSVTDAAALIEGAVGGLLIGNAAGTVTNLATIEATSSSRGAGVGLYDGGDLTNGSLGDKVAQVSGYFGVFCEGAGAATVTNFGTIEGMGGAAVQFTSASSVLIVEAGSTFIGAVNGDGGTLTLANGTGTLKNLFGASGVTVSGSMKATVFQAFDAVEIGAGARFSDTGAVKAAAGQTVNDAGTLTLGIGKARVTTAGLIETSGTGLLTLAGAVNSTGTLAVDGGTLTVDGAVTGKGVATIDGGTLDLASSFGQNVTFSGTTGVLDLAQSQGYSGTVTGFSKTGGTSLDLADIGFVSPGEATFSGTKTGGVLTVTDGSHTATIKLKGNYLSSTFIAASDGNGGAIVTDTKTKGGPVAVYLSPHPLIAAMASLGPQTAAGWASQVNSPSAPLLAPRLLAPRAPLA